MRKRPPLPPWLEHAAAIRKNLKDRGFKPADRVQRCDTCGEYAEEAWTLRGPQTLGGRDVVYCASCGRSRSWRGQGAFRAVEEPFDLLGFLGVAPPA